MKYFQKLKQYFAKNFKNFKLNKIYTKDKISRLRKKFNVLLLPKLKILANKGYLKSDLLNCQHFVSLKLFRAQFWAIKDLIVLNVKIQNGLIIKGNK